MVPMESRRFVGLGGQTSAIFVGVEESCPLRRTMTSELVEFLGKHLHGGQVRKWAILGFFFLPTAPQIKMQLADFGTCGAKFSSAHNTHMRRQSRSHWCLGEPFVKFTPAPVKQYPQRTAAHPSSSFQHL